MVVISAPRIMPEECVEVVATLVNAVVPPTAPLKVMLPTPEVIVSARAPFTVELNDTLLPVELFPKVESVRSAPSVTAPV